MDLFNKILIARGLNPVDALDFFSPIYEKNHDPFLLKDMDKAVDRLLLAYKNKEKITIYGDYDIDGLTSVSLLLDAFESFGFNDVDVFMPNRFIEGYGLTIDAIDQISARKTDLIVTVDCGSLSEKEIIHSNDLGMDIIVTDHHNVAAVQPPAVAVVNPKRSDNDYPFRDLAGVGVAFKLVQALQTRLNGLPLGHEKWLLDLVALGTVCDVVSLTDENRTFVYWGLKVLSQTRRPGLKALMKVSIIDPKNINARSLGFGLGPRMNAAGRLETAQHALDLLIAKDSIGTMEKAQYLDDLNISRRFEQSKILKQAIVQAEKYSDDSVLVVSDADWSHGIVGIVASKLLEKYKKPVFVIQEMGEDSKGSARSFGDFSVADAVKFCKEVITKGGGHKMAAGVTLPTKNIDSFRKMINQYYKSLNLVDQSLLLLPREDVSAKLNEVDESLIKLISQLEPFGSGNLEPIIKTDNLKVSNVRKMGSDGQHIKIELTDGDLKMDFIAFNAQDSFMVDIGDNISIWYQPGINQWQGKNSVEGKILHIIVNK